GLDLTGGNVHHLQITLPNLNWGVKFFSATLLTADNITCTLTRAGVPGTAQTLGPVTVQRSTQLLNLARTIAFNRGQKDIYMLDSDPTRCFARTLQVNADHTATTLHPFEPNYTVKVDTGSTLTECNSTNNAETNNTRT